MAPSILTGRLNKRARAGTEAAAGVAAESSGRGRDASSEPGSVLSGLSSLSSSSESVGSEGCEGSAEGSSGAAGADGAGEAEAEPPPELPPAPLPPPQAAPPPQETAPLPGAEGAEAAGAEAIADAATTGAELPPGARGTVYCGVSLPAESESAAVSSVWRGSATQGK